MSRSRRVSRPDRRSFVFVVMVAASALVGAALVALVGGASWIAVAGSTSAGLGFALASSLLGFRWSQRPLRERVSRLESELPASDISPPLDGRSLGALITSSYQRQRARCALVGAEVEETADMLRVELDRATRLLEAERSDARRELAALREQLATRSRHVTYLLEEVGRPLGALIGASELMLESPLSDGQRHLLERSLEGQQSLASLLDDYWTNRINPIERFSVAPRSSSLRRAVTEILWSMAPRAAHAGVELVVRFASDAPSHCLVDPDRLRQVLSAFVSFAVTRSRSGCVYINVSLHERPRADDGLRRVLRFTIEGTGPVLSDEERGSLFSFVGGRTELIGEVPKPSRELAIAGDLVTALGGSAWVERSSLSGTQLAFSLPITRQKRVTATTLFGRGAITDKAVLVVDDLAQSRAVVSELLSSWRLLPTAVSDADQAMEALRSAARTQQPFDVLVIDRGIGQASGVCLLDQIARDERVGPQRVVLLDQVNTSAQPLPEEVRGMVAASILKPIFPSELLEAVTTVIDPPRTAPRVITRSNARPDPSKRSVKILVAEDNPVNQMFTVRMLDKRGHQVTVASNGADVIDYLDTTPEPFDIILMDIQMPVLDGVEATAIIRERERRKGSTRVPIIAVTAHAMRGEKQRCLDAGMDGYIPKPIVEERLMAEIESHLPDGFHERPPRALSGASAIQGEVEGRIFDEDKVLDFIAGDTEFLVSLVELFALTAPKQIEEIGRAVEGRDGQGLCRAAHQLKGSVGNFAAERARYWAYELEKLGKVEDFAQAEVALGRLSEEIERLKVALEELSARHLAAQ